MKPFVKWQGGKRRELANIRPFVSSPVAEPFCGGAAVAFLPQPTAGNVVSPYRTGIGKGKVNFRDILNPVGNEGSVQGDTLLGITRTNALRFGCRSRSAKRFGRTWSPR